MLKSMGADANYTGLASCYDYGHLQGVLRVVVHVEQGRPQRALVRVSRYA